MGLKTNFWIEATLKYKITLLLIMEIGSVTFALILVECSKIEAGLMELWYSKIVALVSVPFALTLKADSKVSPRGKICQNIDIFTFTSVWKILKLFLYEKRLLLISGRTLFIEKWFLNSDCGLHCHQYSILFFLYTKQNVKIIVLESAASRFWIFWMCFPSCTKSLVVKTFLLNIN